VWRLPEITPASLEKARRTLPVGAFHPNKPKALAGDPGLPAKRLRSGEYNICSNCRLIKGVASFESSAALSEAGAR